MSGPDNHPEWDDRPEWDDYEAGLYLDKCPFCSSTGPLTVWCKAWFEFESGEPARQVAEEIGYAMPLIGTKVFCDQCQRGWVVGQDPHSVGPDGKPGYLPVPENDREQSWILTAQRNAVAAVGAARRRRERAAALRARLSVAPQGDSEEDLS